MNQKYTIHELVNLYYWNHSDVEASAKQKALQEYLDLQIMNRQVNLINFFYSERTNGWPKVSLITLVTQIRKQPVKFISKFSSHILNRVSDWLLTFITKPESSADAISVYFTSKNDHDFLLFTASTFPSIYHNFVTYELQSAAYKFIMRFLQYHSKSFTSKLIKAFVQANHYFFNSLWTIFDEKVSFDESVSNIFYHFLSSLKIASNALTSFQHDALFSFYKKDKHSFAHSIIKGLFIRKYVEAHCDVLKKAETHSIVKVLSFAASNSESSHFAQIIEALFNSKYQKFIPRHSESTFDNSTLIIFSLYELTVLQKIVQNNRETFNYPQNEPESLQIPIEKVPNFESVYININLRPYFGSEAESSIFKFDSSFMFDDLKSTTVENSPSNQLQWDRLSIVARTYSTTELSIFLQPQQVPEARPYIEKIPFKDKNFYDYLTTRFRNSMVDGLKLFDSFISKKSIWSIFNEAFNACYNDLATSISNITKKVAEMRTNPNPNPRKIKNSSSTFQDIKKNRSSTIKHATNLHSIAMTMPTPLQDDLFGDNDSKNKNDETDTQSKKADSNDESIKSSTKNSHKNDHHIHSHRKKRHHHNHKNQNNQVRQRRKSVDFDTIQSKNETTGNLLDILSSIRNNDSKMWIYLRNLDDYNSTDKTVTELSNMYHSLMDGLRLKLIIQKDYHQVYKVNFLEKCSKKIDDLLNFKRGTALIHLFQITLDLHEICKYCFDGNPTDEFNSQSSKYFTICLLLTHNDHFYESFLWFQKMCFNYPDFKSLIPQKMQLIVAFYEALFWQFLKDLEGSLFERTKDCCQYLYK